VVARFEVVPVGEVTAPGGYEAVGSLSDRNGNAFPLTGELSVHTGLSSGSFALQEPGGGSVTGEYECVIR
jgi:hypothetical protein